MQNKTNFTQNDSLGACPICGSDVHEVENEFSCQKLLESKDPSNPSCTFKIAKIILAQFISRDQCIKFLKDGCTDYFDGFTSNRTQKTFRARLYWDIEVGKVAMDISELEAAPKIKKQNQINIEKLNHQKFSNDFSSVMDKFNKNHHSASEEFLNELFEISSGLDLHFASAKEFSKISNLVRTIDQSVLNSFVERDDCPNWLGSWIAKFGKKDQQLAYLFQPSIVNDILASERIANRPPEIVRLFKSSKSMAVIDSLLNYDDFTYLDWAQDLSLNIEISEPNLEPDDEKYYVPSRRIQINEWIEENFNAVTDDLWDKYVPKEGPCTVLQGEMVRCIGRLMNEYWKNGMMNMGNGTYDRMVDKIKNTILLDDSFNSFTKRVVQIDASIVKNANYSQIVNLTLFQESSVENSLNRLRSVTAAWCLKHPEPIPYGVK
jgi:hypothetical protein